MEFTANRQSPVLTPGYRLDRYELLAPIAQGGMATVWVAQLQGKHGFQRLCAIKTILPERSTDDRFRTMFLDEARIAARVIHPNVAQILELGEQDGILYIVMEWVDGCSVSKLKRTVERQGHTLPLPVALRLVADAAAGLHAAHELRDERGESLAIVHRDVSPQNLLVGLDGTAKIIDFGIAKAKARLAGETQGGLLKGKLTYMAPEQAMGKTTTRRADIWALGAVLYDMIATRPPYKGDNDLETMMLLTSGRPPPRLPPATPEPVGVITRCCLSFDPSVRYPTALHVKNAIAEAMRELGLSPTREDVAECLRKYIPEHFESRRTLLDEAVKAAAQRASFEQAIEQVPSTAGSAHMFIVRPREDDLPTITMPRDSGDQSATEPSTLRDGAAAAERPTDPAEEPPTGEPDTLPEKVEGFADDADEASTDADTSKHELVVAGLVQRSRKVQWIVGGMLGAAVILAVLAAMGWGNLIGSKPGDHAMSPSVALTAPSATTTVLGASTSTATTAATVQPSAQSELTTRPMATSELTAKPTATMMTTAHVASTQIATAQAKTGRGQRSDKSKSSPVASASGNQTAPTATATASAPQPGVIDDGF